MARPKKTPPPTEDIDPNEGLKDVKKTNEYKSIRLSAYTGSQEFGMNKTTVLARFREMSILPGPDGHWSISDFCKAKYNDKELEQIRKTKAEANLAEYEDAKQRGELLRIDTVVEMCESIATIIRQRILGSNIPKNEQDEILAELHVLLDPGELERRGSEA